MACMSDVPATIPRPPRAAATVVIVRDGPSGIEVLLCRRAERGDHNSGAWVFPGGLVDKGDREAHACCVGLDDAAASATLGIAEGGLDYYIAAVRESFEEAGLLFAVDPRGELVQLDHPEGAIDEAHLSVWREPLNRGERGIREFCDATGLRLAVDRLVYFSHWLTPLGRAKRFDTRFFIAAAPPGQDGMHDGAEMVEQQWLRPVDALARSDSLKLMNPTRHSLELIQHFDSVAATLAWARAPRDIALILPRIGTGGAGAQPVNPGAPAWAEIGRLDPHGQGQVSYDIRPDVPVRLSERVIRVTADNGSVMTGPGTNSYLVGGGERNEWAVIDPGPLREEHVDAILAAAPGPIRWIFATHTHNDHSPATVSLKARTGALTHGRVADHPQWQDASFVPDVPLAGGEVFALPGGATLRVVHTPGHASNHLCYLLEEEKLLFTGDHVMQASTVVINPPDGDMAAYVASLRSLLEVDLEWLAPGHGFLMGDPKRALQAIIDHRLRREAKVVGALRALGPDAGIDALLAKVYDDVSPRLLAMATRSLTAHLNKLVHDGAATKAGGADERWSLVEG
jgi:glyoxylase-like metal-dependent hydrolase (beta-lactamase superfamily II)/8-oxo-dGTP pyrophosphatase MutT (NUDIX family)